MSSVLIGRALIASGLRYRRSCWLYLCWRGLGNWLLRITDKSLLLGLTLRRSGLLLSRSWRLTYLRTFVPVILICTHVIFANRLSRLLPLLAFIPDAHIASAWFSPALIAAQVSRTGVAITGAPLVVLPLLIRALAVLFLALSCLLALTYHVSLLLP
jgi:hypothetical protein